jgi:hypothetical protein
VIVHHRGHPFLERLIEIVEDGGPFAARQQLQDEVDLIGLQIVEQLGGVGRVMVVEKLAQAGLVTLRDDLTKVGS